LQSTGVAGLVYTVSVDLQQRASQNGSSEESETPGHVLLVNYFFPPMTGGGVPRPVKMAKYLRRLGWAVTVLTVEASGQIDQRLSAGDAAEVLRVREWRLGWLLRTVGRSIRLMRRGWERLTRRRSAVPTLLDRGFAYEEQEIESSKIGWVAPAVRAAMHAHRRKPIDVAIVSLPPAASGTVGWLLRRLRGVPYVVEYRDPWTVGAFWMADADGRPRTDLVTRARFRLTQRLEATLLRGSAGSIIVNGEAHIGRLAASFADQTAGKPIVHIRNGVDCEDIEHLQRDRSPSTVLRLLHTGFFYHFYTPHHLITALRLVQRDHPETLDGIELEFMGDGFPEQLVREVEGWGLSNLIRRTDAGSYSEALAAMHRADGLMAVLPPLDSDRDRLPTKVYEYLSTDRPILAVAHADGAAAQLLHGVPDALVVDNGDQAAIADAFVAFVALARRRRTDGYPPENGRRGEIHHYHERAVQMNAFLHQVLASRDAMAAGAPVAVQMDR
jgi:glycosyltransferase involved in cell wall biosynthesis